MNIKNATEEVLEKVYLKDGLLKTLEVAEHLLKETEGKVGVQKECGLIKGELAELVLYYILLELQQVLKVPSIVVKGLYVQDKDTGQVTELDVTFITKKQIYMFECKSYAGKSKILTDKCKLWVSEQERADVFEQNKLHTLTFNKMYGRYTLANSKPYTMILFDYSTHPFVDKRDEAYRRAIPVLTQQDIIPWLIADLNKHSTSKVNISGIKNAIRLNKSKFQKGLAEEHRRQLGYKET